MTEKHQLTPKEEATKPLIQTYTSTLYLCSKGNPFDCEKRRKIEKKLTPEHDKKRAEHARFLAHEHAVYYSSVRMKKNSEL